MSEARERSDLRSDQPRAAETIGRRELPDLTSDPPPSKLRPEAEGLSPPEADLIRLSSTRPLFERNTIAGVPLSSPGVVRCSEWWPKDGFPFRFDS